MDMEDKIARHCWTKEGLWGDSSCPELRKYIHCYNCPVYSAAGKKLFDRRVPIEYVEQWAGEISESRAYSLREKTPYFLFKCGGENLALEMRAVSEVARDRFIHRIPHKGDGVISGLANINGELVIAVDIARLLGIGGCETPSSDSVRGRQVRIPRGKNRRNGARRNRQIARRACDSRKIARRICRKDF